MARDSHSHLPPSAFDAQGVKRTSRSQLKQELGARLTDLLTARDWTQADLARAAKLGPDLISSYVRGRSLPSTLNMRRIAAALGVEPEALLPETAAPASEETRFEMREAANQPGMAWVQVNRLVTYRQALAIAAIIDGVGSKEVDAILKRIQVARIEDQGDLPLPESN